MNRRNFLTSLLAIPAVASVVPKALASPVPKKVVMSTQYGYLGDDIRRLMILNPSELRRNGFTPVATPCFLEENVPYCVKTWRLKTYCDGEPNMRAIINAKAKVLAEMKRLQLTHIYCIAFNPAPIWMHNNVMRYSAFVRGCRLKPWDELLRVSAPESYDAKSA
jgi:hypothetical protein